jgi:hypothetical protein
MLCKWQLVLRTKSHLQKMVSLESLRKTTCNPDPPSAYHNGCPYWPDTRVSGCHYNRNGMKSWLEISHIGCKLLLISTIWKLLQKTLEYIPAYHNEKSSYYTHMKEFKSMKLWQHVAAEIYLYRWMRPSLTTEYLHKYTVSTSGLICTVFISVRLIYNTVTLYLLANFTTDPNGVCKFIDCSAMVIFIWHSTGLETWMPFKNRCPA